MPLPSRMPNYDVRNDGTGPYAVFYCETCNREYRTQPDVKGAVVQDLGRRAAGDFLRKVPLFGGELARSVGSYDKHTLPLILFLDLLETSFFFNDFDMIFPGEIFKSLRVGEVLMLHYKIDRITHLPASETLKYLL